ncbi:uncharacterized protein [Spinacia oleracea]|uniref:Retrotransposon gag domain-containing protein n=1 Tax=Spinacia oleracea TaxID=3562 RepID=A0ABM3QQ24_SPIOL|nr:uncharacterized protein LOC130461396 [Spinacia oleracea]
MEKIKIPTCKYAGKTDPVNHLSSFGGHMMLYTNTDSMWCKVFPSTLEGIGQSWERMTGELMSVVQGSQESLRDYISRFNMEASNIIKLQQEVIVLAMMSGMQDGEFKSYLGRKSFTALEVLGKANEFIKSEEIVKATSRRYVAGENNYTNQNRKEPYRKEYADRRDNHQAKNERGGPSRGKEDEKWQRPPKMDHGHLTEECTHLKDNIEDMIRRGYLTKLKAKSSYSRTYENRDNDGKFENKKLDHKKNHPADQKRSGDILVITGGPVYAGTIASGAKASVNEFRH